MQKAFRSNFTNIFVKNTTVRAAACEHCGAKIYPTNLLKLHLHRHQLKHDRLERELKQLQLAVAHVR